MNGSLKSELRYLLEIGLEIMGLELSGWSNVNGNQFSRLPV
jgi:hypothetical protein